MRSPRIGASLHSSWLAMALAGALTVAAPLTARLAGDAVVQGPSARAVAAPVQGDPARARAHPAAERPVAPRTEPRPRPHLLVDARSDVVAYRHPSRSAARLGEVAVVSRFYHQRLVWWIEEVVERRGEILVRVPGATGASVSPTPPGEYVVTDHVAFGAGSSLGSFAFGISGIQPNLPPGWSGGDQLAIHGTNDPSSIGRSVSAGCVRVSEWALDRFKPLLRQGTPVIIVP